MLQLAAARRKDQIKGYFNRAILGPKLLVIDELGILPSMEIDVLMNIDDLLPLFGPAFPGWQGSCDQRGRRSF